MSSLTESILHWQDINIHLDTKFTKDSLWKQIPYTNSYNILMRRQTDNYSKENIHETKGKFSGYEKSSNQIPTQNSNDCACCCPIDDKRSFYSSRSRMPCHSPAAVVRKDRFSVTVISGYAIISSQLDHLAKSRLVILIDT